MLRKEGSSGVEGEYYGRRQGKGDESRGSLALE